MANRNLKVWGLGFLALLLVAGSAFAASESIALTIEGQRCVVTAVLVPGPEGGECSIGWVDEEDLRIPLDPTGHQLNVTIDIRQIAGGWIASYTVRDMDDGGCLVDQQLGIVLGGEPNRAQATGLSVTSLSAE